MIFGAILAGGTGSRMKQKIPKQFIELNNVPIIIRTLKRMLEVNEFDHICIGIHPDYNNYLQDLLKQYTIDSKKILTIPERFKGVFKRGILLGNQADLLE